MVNVGDWVGDCFWRSLVCFMSSVGRAFVKGRQGEHGVWEEFENMICEREPLWASVKTLALPMCSR